MVFAPVGIRCLDHASQASGPAKPAMHRRPRSARAGFWNQEGVVTRILIGINVAVYSVNLLQGASLSRNGGSLFNDWLLNGPAVANGDWWRLITAAFLHGSIIHIALNMLFLWIIGTPLEIAIGRWRYLAIYIVTALAGSAGALVFTPEANTVGASGAIYGILGAAVVLEQQGINVLGGSALGLAILNFALSLTIPGVSIGGHLGGFIGGIACGLAVTRFGRGHAAYGRLGIVGIATIVAVGVASVLVAYLQVRDHRDPGPAPTGLSAGIGLCSTTCSASTSQSGRRSCGRLGSTSSSSCCCASPGSGRSPS